jgi:hypothetical protein
VAGAVAEVGAVAVAEVMEVVAEVAAADCVAVRKSERGLVPAAMRLARPVRLARRRSDPLGPGLMSRVGWLRRPVLSG